MVVRVLEAGHDHAPVQVDDVGGASDVAGRAAVAADVHDAAVADRERLRDAVTVIDGVDESVAHHGVRGAPRIVVRGGGGRPERGGHQGRAQSERADRRAGASAPCLAAHLARQAVGRCLLGVHDSPPDLSAPGTRAP